MLTREEILKKNVLQVVPVTITDWQGEIYFKQLSARQVLAIQKFEDDKPSFVLQVAITSACDESGNALFTEADKDFLESQPVSVYKDFVAGFMKANKLSDDDQSELKKT